ncbi:hypothetical protein [Aeoliella mucimassa]|uniref:Secreted protein n=1 Tax=Aeoliella mucimassa TaxID=2527972 RepID=A0A518ARH8_9BACT|nr:hypothetical protein [Aeoliella mucimassa]QDU57316.1 hypothetical protein Pan181_35310 [Aeoliella mucimassa]
MHGTTLRLSANLLATCLMVSTAQAFWGTQSTECCGPCQPQSPASDVCAYLKAGYDTNSMWPYPYVCPDRVRAHAPFEVMVQNGWRRQNLLGAHYFDRETGKLTRAGELKIEWILTQTPPSRRQVFVERSMDTSVTQERMTQVETFANNIQTNGEQIAVIDTHIRSASRPASMVDAERNSFIESRPPAVLPAGTTSTTTAN